MSNTHQKIIRRMLENVLFHYNYQDGLRRISALIIPKHAEPEREYALGLLYDHLAIKEKLIKKKRFYEQKAVRYYTHLHKLCPKDIRVYFGLGRIALQRKRYSEALRYYLYALTLQPNKRAAQLAYGAACIWAKKITHARNIFLADLEKNGPSFRSYYHLTLLERAAGRQKKAAMYAEKAVKIFNRWPRWKRKSPGGKTWMDILRKLLIDS